MNIQQHILPTVQTLISDTMLGCGPSPASVSISETRALTSSSLASSRVYKSRSHDNSMYTNTVASPLTDLTATSIILSLIPLTVPLYKIVN